MTISIIIPVATLVLQQAKSQKVCRPETMDKGDQGPDKGNRSVETGRNQSLARVRCTVAGSRPVARDFAGVA